MSPVHRVLICLIVLSGVLCEEVSLSACRRGRHLAPDIFIVVWVNHISNAMRATKAGADHVAIQEVITGQSMQEAVMARLVGED